MSKKSDGPNYLDKWNPFEDLFRTVNHFMQEPPVRGFLQHMDEFFKQPFPHVSFPIDVKDTGDRQIVTAQLPGVKKEQIAIDILGNHLTISVKQQDILTEEDDNNQIYRRSESIQRSSRTITFSHPIDESKVKASYQNGLLKITIPKQPGKKIEIIE
ncbi:Hsp20/alpha crystallin family protein [Bacillus sp. B15-48]|uniref:Hsp20/alpha crystallin family protein n=1 Tax=Bacillus sp. B15-48 TaxID=1548601 RepID=UPI00193FCE66|nr:Hsp20/alpha crystallin family protein [Bacillus sp. B15-48]MBM4760901.1 Hsp20 family protein [Bacillus sp. B15-48]